MVVLLVGALVLGVAAAVGAVLGDAERVTGYWASAQVGDDGSAQVTEVIDYSFGIATDKHGIFRIIPGLTVASPVTVTSPDAPDDVEVTPEITGSGEGIRIRIGDPATTVTGRRRYQIDYTLPGVRQGDTVDWEAVGSEWEVGMDRAEVHLVTPFELVDGACFVGGSGSSRTCTLNTVEPGHVVATVEDLGDHEGVSIEGTAGAPLPATPAAPAPPAGRPENPSTGLVPPAGTAAAAALVAAVPVTAVVRRAGRERVAPGGATEAAFGGAPPSPPPAGLPAPPGAPELYAPPPVGELRLDEAALAQMATTEFAPPDGVEPSQGGVILREEVLQEHKVAWLLQLAIQGIVDIDESHIRFVGSTVPTPDQRAVLDLIFAEAGEVELGSYDASFASGWGRIGDELESWRETSGLWDLKADRRRVVGLVGGIIAVVVGLAVTVLGGVLAGSRGAGGLAVAATGGGLAGAGLGLAMSASELRVRTALGSALWLRVESFRRFLAGSEAYHAEEAAKRGVLREYTAWALALGEIDRWSRAVAAAAIPPDIAGASYVYIGPLLMASTMTTATPPSSSGSGGSFGGGGVGGGAGGGGGGSW